MARILTITDGKQNLHAQLYINDKCLPHNDKGPARCSLLVGAGGARFRLDEYFWDGKGAPHGDQPQVVLREVRNGREEIVASGNALPRLTAEERARQIHAFVHGDSNDRPTESACCRGTNKVPGKAPKAKRSTNQRKKPSPKGYAPV